jgi:membrane protease YdiL (CAAX protease family)
VTALFPALLLALIFGLLSGRVQAGLRGVLHRRAWTIWLVPPLLTGVFGLAALSAGAVSLELTAMVLAYTAAPVLCAAVQGPGRVDRPTVLDFATILLLWLPLEFPAGAAHLVAKHAQGFLHSVAYGIAILLGLILFAGFRAFPGLKYNLPRGARDLWLALAGFALAAPVLAGIGIWTGFIPPFHLPTVGAGKMAAAAGIIFAATGLPEEILFRGLIQNLLALRFGAGARTLIAASLIFGAAHLDNGPQPLPNWRYAIVATIAGFAFGKVFQKSATVLSPAACHTGVNTVKYLFF